MVFCIIEHVSEHGFLFVPKVNKELSGERQVSQPCKQIYRIILSFLRRPGSTFAADTLQNRLPLSG